MSPNVKLKVLKASYTGGKRNVLSDHERILPVKRRRVNVIAIVREPELDVIGVDDSKRCALPAREGLEPPQSILVVRSFFSVGQMAKIKCYIRSLGSRLVTGKLVWHRAPQGWIAEAQDNVPSRWHDLR